MSYTLKRGPASYTFTPVTNGVRIIGPARKHRMLSTDDARQFWNSLRMLGYVVF